MPRANDGHVPVELLTGPTKNVLISRSSLTEPYLIIEAAPMA